MNIKQRSVKKTFMRLVCISILISFYIISSGAYAPGSKALFKKRAHAQRSLCLKPDSLRPLSSAISGRIKASETIANAALFLVEEIHAQKMQYVVMSGRSSALSYTLFVNTWNILYPGKPMPKILRLNTTLKDRGNPLHHLLISTLFEKEQTRDLGRINKLRIAYLDDYIEDGLKFRQLKRGFTKSGLANITFFAFLISDNAYLDFEVVAPKEKDKYAEEFIDYIINYTRGYKGDDPDALLKLLSDSSLQVGKGLSMISDRVAREISNRETKEIKSPKSSPGGTKHQPKGVDDELRLTNIKETVGEYRDAYEKLNSLLKQSKRKNIKERSIKEKGLKLKAITDYYNFWKKLSADLGEENMLIYPLRGLDVIPQMFMKTWVINDDPNDTERGYKMFTEFAKAAGKEQIINVARNNEEIPLRSQQALDPNNYVQAFINHPDQRKILILKGFFHFLELDEDIEHIEEFFDIIFSRDLKEGDRILILDKNDLKMFNNYLHRRRKAPHNKVYFRGFELKGIIEENFESFNIHPQSIWDTNGSPMRAFLLSNAVAIFEKVIPSAEDSFTDTGIELPPAAASDETSDAITQHEKSLERILQAA